VIGQRQHLDTVLCRTEGYFSGRQKSVRRCGMAVKIYI
jgi:hypothetical protein